jgi:hypothetical protein
MLTKVTGKDNCGFLAEHSKKAWSIYLQFGIHNQNNQSSNLLKTSAANSVISFSVISGNKLIYKRFLKCSK